jgi:hypothetical protein
MNSKPANYNSKFLAGGLLHPGRRPALFIGLLTLALLLISAAAHFSTYVNVNISRDFPWLWLALHLSILIHFAIYWRYKRRPAFKGPAAYVEEPLVVVFLLAILIGFALFYAMINFAYYYWVLRYGYPDQVGGQFFLILPHGQKPLALSPDQFSLDELYQARKVSGHWMLCHLMPLMGYYDWLTDRVV